MTGRDPGQLAHGQRRDDERRETDHDGGCDREIGVPAAEGVAHRPDADREVAPVLDRVEGRSNAMKKPRSKSLDQHEHAEQGPDHPRHEAPCAGRQRDGQADEDESLEREPREGARA